MIALIALPIIGVLWATMIMCIIICLGNYKEYKDKKLKK